MMKFYVSATFVCNLLVDKSVGTIERPLIDKEGEVLEVSRHVLHPLAFILVMIPGVFLV